VLSLEVTGAVIDEFVEIPKEIIEALSGRCGRYPSPQEGGCTWWGMWGASNPGNEDNWWYDWLYSQWDDRLDENGELVDGVAAKENTLGYFEQPGGFHEDAENLDNLPGKRAYYSNLAVGKSDEWVQQFINVQWGFSLQGTPVFKAFRPVLHVATESLRFSKHLPVLIGFDAGLTPAAILGQYDAHGRMVVLRELISENMGARRFCKELLGPLLRRECPDNEIELIGDPAFTQRAQTDEKSVRQIIEEELGIEVRPAPSNNLVDRIGAVEDLLTRLTDVGPAYLIDPCCKTLIRGFTSGYHYAISKKGNRGDKPDKNRYSHPHDANQYLCLGATRLTRTAQRKKKLAALLNSSPSVSYNFG